MKKNQPKTAETSKLARPSTTTTRSRSSPDARPPDAHDLIWKLFGYYGGPRVLDVVIDGSMSGLATLGGPGAHDTTLCGSRSRLVALAIAALCLPVTGATTPGLLDLSLRIQKFEDELK